MTDEIAYCVFRIPYSVLLANDGDAKLGSASRSLTIRNTQYASERSERTMGFFMDGLDADQYDRTYGDRVLLRRILGYFRPHRRPMLLVSAVIVVGACMSAALPFLLSRGIDALAGDRSFRTTLFLVAGILTAGVVGWCCQYLRMRTMFRVIGDVVLRVREDAFDAVLARDLSFYDEEPSGKIVARVTSDTESFAQTVTLCLNLISQLLVVGLVVAILFAIDWRLALVTLGIAPVVIAAALTFRRVARHSVQQSQRVGARVNANVQEAVSGIGVAKAFRQEQAVYEHFLGLNTQSYRINLKSGFVFSGIFPILGTITGVGAALLILVGGVNVLDGTISAGDWFLFMQSIIVFWMPLTSIAAFWSQFQLGLAAGERIFALIDAEPRVVQTDRRPVPRLSGRVEFRDVDFRYTDQEAVLQGFSLTIPAGQTVALVGHTGAGKSTLGKLVARFYEFQRGAILLDGMDLRTFDLEDYRRQLGVVGQLPFLFDGTVADNIRYARPEVTDEELARVARAVGGGDWLEALPQGLQTHVGEAGRSLSLGQRQLVALARVLLQDPAIVILDEATASVDPLTEAQIQEGLDAVLAGRTAIVIAHRLSTIEHADRIIVLSHGRIAEEGTHASLLERGGHYAGLYNTYFRHQSPDYRPGEGFVTVSVDAGSRRGP
jgi:ATP-binding cassette, subfamily B, bacterial